MFDLKKPLIAIFAFITLFGVTNLAAQSFRGDALLMYFNEKKENLSGDTTESTMYGGQLGFYFSSVYYEDGPWKEAAFLQKTGNIQASVLKCDFTDSGVDGLRYSAKAEYVTPFIPVFLSAGLAYLDFDGSMTISSTGYPITLEETEIPARIGLYITDTSLFCFNYRKTSDKITIDMSTDGMITSVETVENSLGLSYKTIFDAEEETSFTIECAYNRINFKETNSTTLTSTGTTTSSSIDGGNNEFNLLAEYYLSPEISIGAGAKINRGDNQEKEGITAKGLFSIFFTANLGFAFEYTRFIPKDTDYADKSNAFFIGIAGRI